MDTVVYKLHRPERYPIIIKAVQALKDGKGFLMIPDTAVHRKETKFSKIWVNLKMDSYHMMTYNVKADLPSSSGSITIMYDEQKEYIKFEFSIPKFFFGNNVCELLPAVASKHYDPTNLSMENLSKFWYRLLKVTFYKIIHDLTRGLFTDFSWTDVQVSRIDIPFNQIFDNSKDALHMLDSIKKVSLPRVKEENKMNYGNGATFKSPDYYFKVYYKGADFHKTGRNQIRNHCDDLLKKGLLRDGSNIALSMRELDNLQDVADRTLRYELECKSGLLKRLFNNNLKKAKIPQYLEMRNAVMLVMSNENYPLIRAAKRWFRDDAGNLVKKPANTLLRYTAEYYLPLQYFDPEEEKRGEAIVTDEKLIRKLDRLFYTLSMLRTKFMIMNFRALKSVHKMMLRDLDQHHEFYFEIEEVDAARAIGKQDGIHYDCDAMTIFEETPKKQRFSSSLLKLCIMQQNYFFKKLQFSEMPSVKYYELLADEYNKSVSNSWIPTGEKQQKVHKNQLKHRLKMVFVN